MRLPFNPRLKATPSSAAHTTISRECRVRRFAAVSASSTQCGQRSQVAVEIAAIGTESTCEPKSIGGTDGRTRATSEIFPAGSTRGSRPAVRIKPIMYRRPATSASEGDAADTVGERPAGRSAERTQRLDPLPQTRSHRHEPGCFAQRYAGLGRRAPLQPRRDSLRTRAWMGRT